MGFSCFLFGHDFGDAEVEREREEQGSEVVTTIRERETCSRCGTQRVVSENTEVTTLETPADIVGDDLTDESADEPESSASGSAADSEVRADDAGEAASPDADTAGGEEVTVPDAEAGAATGGAGVDHATDPATTGVDADTDDGVILDETGEGTEAGEDERQPGQWPEDSDGDGGEDWAPDTELDPGTESPEVESTAEAVTVPSGEFHCPECGFSTPVESSSLREGDFCPECHRGSLAHRPDE